MIDDVARIILVIAAVIIICNQIRLEIQAKKLKAESEKITRLQIEKNILQSEENRLLKKIFSEQLEELKEKVRKDDVTTI